MKISIVALFEMPQEMFVSDEQDPVAVELETIECPEDDWQESLRTVIGDMRRRMGNSAKLKSISHQFVPEG